MKSTKLIVAAGVLAMIGASMAYGVVYTEDFESGYTVGTNLRDHADWWGQEDPAKNPVIYGDQGVNGSVGLGPAMRIYNWTANSFNWNDPGFVSVAIAMDFNTPEFTNEYFPFDDDYVGWTIDGESDESLDTFAVQLDGGEIKGYWADSSGTKQTPTIAVLPTVIDPETQMSVSALKEFSWYRFAMEVTKLTDTSARIDVSLTELDVDGNPVEVVVTGTFADTSVPTSAGAIFNTKYFTATEAWASFKNYNDKCGGFSDNAYLEVVPEPASLLFLSIGGLFIARRRR